MWPLPPLNLMLVRTEKVMNYRQCLSETVYNEQLNDYIKQHKVLVQAVRCQDGLVKRYMFDLFALYFHVCFSSVFFSTRKGFFNSSKLTQKWIHELQQRKKIITPFSIGCFHNSWITKSSTHMTTSNLPNKCLIYCSHNDYILIISSLYYPKVIFRNNLKLIHKLTHLYHRGMFTNCFHNLIMK